MISRQSIWTDSKWRKWKQENGNSDFKSEQTRKWSFQTPSHFESYNNFA